ncbi:MAG TPA: hypothetical protein VM094_08230 [Gemmatimonadales bacterium]|nr:hypothetical protein [Gemmatimonadales bacterium]
MRWIRLLFRIFGWLLTPFLAWAASFFGAVGGALVAIRMEDPVEGLAVTALCGALTGFTGLIAWLEYLRRSPEVRGVLAVTEDGTPDTIEILIPEPAPDAAPHSQ